MPALLGPLVKRRPKTLKTWQSGRQTRNILSAPLHTKSSWRTKVRSHACNEREQHLDKKTRAKKDLARRGGQRQRQCTRVHVSRCLGHERALVAVQLPTLCRGPAQRTVPFPLDLQ